VAEQHQAPFLDIEVRGLRRDKTKKGSVLVMFLNCHPTISVVECRGGSGVGSPCQREGL